MVCRLVEEQEIGLADERASERDAALFPARERADPGLQRRCVDGVCDGLDALVERPSVGALDGVLELGELGVRALARFVAADPFGQIGGAALDVLSDGKRGIELELLRQIADAHLAAAGNFSRVGLAVAGEDFEEAGLAAAVAAHKANLFTGSERDRRSIEEGLMAEGEADVFGGKQRGG